MPFWYFFTVPKLPQDVSHQSNQVEIQRYTCKEGDAVTAGTPIVIIENYWAVIRLNATGKGMVRKTFFDTGTTVKIGDPIAIMGADGEDLPTSTNSATVEILKRKREKPN